MPTLTALEPQRRHDGRRWNVFVDGAYAVSLHATLAARLRVDEEVDAGALAELAATDERQRALDSAFAFLASRPRSVWEVERRLRQKGYSPLAIAAARERLAHLRLVDDAAFARYWVEQRGAHRPRGRSALRAELRIRGVAPATIGATLPDERAEPEAAYQAGLARLSRLAALEQATFRQRLGSYLTRRGFSHASSAAAIHRLWADRDRGPAGLAAAP